MSKKSDFVAKLLKQVQPRQPLPSAPKQGLTLLEQGAVLILMRHMTQAQAEASVEALRGAYLDWNEVRVTQAQEVGEHFDLKGAKAKAVLMPAATELKAFLKEVFQKTHGLDLDQWREDIQAAGRLIGQMPYTGMAAGSYLLFLAADNQIPMHASLSRFLDKLGLIGRTTSVNKAREAVLPLIPAGKPLEFTVAIHEVMDRWNDRLSPIYLEVEVLRSQALGKKAAQDWQAAKKRIEQQRAREKARVEQSRKKEDARKKREEERERKRIEAEAKKFSREKEKRQRELERVAKKRAAEAKRKADLAKAAKQEAAEKKAAAAKKAADKKKAAADKKKAAADKKKAAAKKSAEAKKKAAASKKAAPRKAALKKAATKKPAAKKPAAKKPAAKKPAAKKPAAKQTAPKKTAAKKVAKKAAAKKTTSKAKKVAKKAAKKPTTRKKAARR